MEMVKGTGTETQVQEKVTQKRERKVKEVKEPTAEEIALQAKKDAVMEIITKGRRGITNFQMLGAMKANLGETENLGKLYAAYPEIFKSSAKYLPNDQKLIMEAVVVAAEPEFKVPMSEKSRTKLTTPVQVAEAAATTTEVAVTQEA